MARIVARLPAPFSPSRPKTEPEGTSRLSRSTAVWPLYLLVKSLIRIGIESLMKPCPP